MRLVVGEKDIKKEKKNIQKRQFLYEYVLMIFKHITYLLHYNTR